MRFYLTALAGSPGPVGTEAVRVPDDPSVRTIIESLYAQGLGEGRFFCGADLEAAVNGAYVRSVRAALPADGWALGGLEDVVVTEEALAESLAAAPRSVQPDSIEQFLADVDRYCNRDVAAAMTRRLKPEPAAHRNGQSNGSAFFGRFARLVPRPLVGRRRHDP